MIKGIICVLVLLCAITNARALEVYQSPTNQQLIVFEDEGHWILDTYADADDGWPEHLSHESFDSREAIEPRLVGARAPNSEIETASLNDVSSTHELPVSRKELKGKKADTGGLWPVTQSWSEDWEAKYVDWVGVNFTPDLFVKANLPTVCSDVAYVLRWVFARENGLPVANRLTSGPWLTQRSVRDSWRRLPTAPEWYNDKRFMAALTYLTHNTYTHTLWLDSYPIAINEQSLTPGAYHINEDGRNAHTMIVYRVGTHPDEVPLVTLSSTVPREVRLLNQFMYTEKKADPHHLAIFKMRWPDPRPGHGGLVRAEDMPGYSLEQFDPDFVRPPRSEFWEEIFYRLNPQLDNGLILTTVKDQIRQMFHLREDTVNRGTVACAAHRCPEGTSGWEDWSTVERDQKLYSDIFIFKKFLNRVSDPSPHTKDLNDTFLTVAGKALSLSELMDIWMRVDYSPDPADTIARRWGIFNKTKHVYTLKHMKKPAQF